jgi:hypothetical protein
MKSLPRGSYRSCWRFIVVVSVVVRLSGCNSPTNETTHVDKPGPEVVSENGNEAIRPQDAKVATNPSFFPTAVGTRWTWHSTVTIGDDQGPIPATVITDTLVSRLAGYDEFNGTKCARIEVANEWGMVVQTEYLSFNADGIYRCGMNQDRFQPPIKVLAMPATVGTTWSGKYTIQGMQVETSSSIAVQEAVTVPAGRFDTVRVEVKHDLLTTTTWYAPGIGVVKQLVDKPVLAQKDSLELAEFSLPDSPAATEN